MQIFVEWLKSNTWVADWVASLVAVIALVGPAIAKAQRVKMDPKSLEVLRQGSAVLWAVMSLVLSKTALLIAVVIELLGLVIKLLLGASANCLYLYFCAITVLILELVSRLRAEINPADDTEKSPA